MNQITKAAKMGTIDVSDKTINDLQEACQAISQMRETLIIALGVKSEGE